MFALSQIHVFANKIGRIRTDNGLTTIIVFVIRGRSNTVILGVSAGLVGSELIDHPIVINDNTEFFFLNEWLGILLRIDKTR